MLVAVRVRCCTLLLYRLPARLIARPGEVRGTGSPTFRFSGRANAQRGDDGQAWRAAAERAGRGLAAAVAVTVAVK
jgi:hypothetical protein